MSIANRLALCSVLAAAACAAGQDPAPADSSSAALGAGGTSASGGMGGLGFGGSTGDGGPCGLACAPDLHSVVSCAGDVVESCAGTSGCNASTLSCTNACEAADQTKSSVGCEYRATLMDVGSFAENACFAVFVANTWNVPAHITVEHAGAALAVESFAYLPSGAGPTLGYAPFDASAGIPPDEVAVLFLSGPDGPTGDGAPCPQPSAIPSGVLLDNTTGIGESFGIASDVPVVAYQFMPYGGGSAAVTGASLLIPTSAWGTNYVAVNADNVHSAGDPSLNIVATEDDTFVDMVPTADVVGGAGVPATSEGSLLSVTLQKGQHLQITQPAGLTGSVIQSSKPVGLMGGHQCMFLPSSASFCDHAEQMIPAIDAMGSEYVGVMYRPRKIEPAIWRVVGVVDGTELSWAPGVGGPTTLNAGEVAQLITGTPFHVESQDDAHPFMLFQYMSGSAWPMVGLSGVGDPDFVLTVPPKQYLHGYVFFTDPTYPETDLVVVRGRGKGDFHDVTLDCAGVLADWHPLGDDYEWTRVDLMTGNFEGVGDCSTGRHTMTSDGPFGLTVWAWGSPATGSETEGIWTQNVSYGYPAGMSVVPINDVVIVPTPK